MKYEDELEALARDAAVRETVFATVTAEEAYRIMRGPLGTPWSDAAAVIMGDAYGMGSSMREVRGLPPEFGRDQ